MARDDFTKSQRDAWQAARLAGERARGQHSSKINQLPRAPDPFGPKGSLSKAANESVASTVKAKTEELDRSIASKAPKGSTITATTPSTCLASLSWQADPDGDGTDGTVTYEFYRGGALVYQDDCTVDEFLDWAESDSLGVTGNSEWFS